MNSAMFIIIAIVIYLVFYFTYGKSLQKYVVKADNNRLHQHIQNMME